jgi:hypothetical protein
VAEPHPYCAKTLSQVLYALLGCFTKVVMDKPSQNISSLHHAMSWLVVWGVGDLLPQALVGAGLVIILAVFT